MKAITTFVLAIAVATSAFGYGKEGKAPKLSHKQAKLADKQEDKTEKAQLKAYCKDHSKVQCKEAKRSFKAEEKAKNKN